MADITEGFDKNSLVNSKTDISHFSKQLNVQDWAENWIMVEAKIYLLTLSLKDADSNNIVLGKNVEFTWEMDGKYLELLHKNIIGSELIFKVMEHPGEQKVAHKTIFKGALKNIKTSQSTKYTFDAKKLKDEKEIVITGPVEITHPTSLILLPYVGGQGEMWQMQATGGSGSYSWSAEDPSIAIVGERDRIYSGIVGMTTVRASDLHNP